MVKLHSAELYDLIYWIMAICKNMHSQMMNYWLWRETERKACIIAPYRPALVEIKFIVNRTNRTER